MVRSTQVRYKLAVFTSPKDVDHYIERDVGGATDTDNTIANLSELAMVR